MNCRTPSVKASGLPQHGSRGRSPSRSWCGRLHHGGRRAVAAVCPSPWFFAGRLRGAGLLVVAIALLLVLALPAAATLSVPALTGRVVDNAGLLSDGGHSAVEEAVRSLEQETGGQMAVLTIPTLAGDALEPFSMRVAETWKIGRKGQDNGAVLVVVRDSHDIRLEVGYGWEGKINDARAGDIIRAMGPFFRGGRFANGLVYAVRQVQTFVTGKTPAGAAPVVPESSAPTHEGTASAWPMLFFVAWIVFLIVLGACRSRTISRHGSRGGFGGFSGGSFGGGGFSGGGGSFGGGGASGKW